MNRTVAACNKFGLKLNINKTKYIIISKNVNVTDNGIFVNGVGLERVERAMYLECQINEKWIRRTKLKYG